MWDLLKQTDIEQAKQQLKLRRCETLRRHAEEIEILDSDRTQLETLNNLIDAFSQKFIKPRTSQQVPISVPAANKNTGSEIPPDVRRQNHPNQSRTNFSQTTFDTFARAVARG